MFSPPRVDTEGSSPERTSGPPQFATGRRSEDDLNLSETFFWPRSLGGVFFFGGRAAVHSGQIAARAPVAAIQPAGRGTDAILAAGRIGSEPHDDLTQA